MNTETIHEVRRSLGWLIGLGVLMIVLGIAAMVEPFVASVVIARVLSWTFLLAGVVRLVHALQSRSQPGFWLKLLVGALFVIAGISLLSDLFGAKLTLTLAFGSVILAQGILEIIAAFKVRPEADWSWMLLSGIVSMILGILILYRWPINAVWLLGFFTGLSFIVTGIWMVMLPRTISNHLSRS